MTVIPFEILLLDLDLAKFTKPFLANVPILYPLKRPKVFEGYKIRTSARNELRRKSKTF